MKPCKKEQSHDVDHWLELGGTVYVESGAGTLQNGTKAFPFDTVVEGVNLAWDGCRLIVDAGSYSETMTITGESTIHAVDGTAVIGN